MKRTALLITGTSLSAAYVGVHYLVDVDLQSEIKHLCDINGGLARRTLDRDSSSTAITLRLVGRSTVDGGLDEYEARLRSSQLAYYWLNLKLAQMLHHQHYVTLEIDCQQHANIHRHGCLSGRMIFYVSEAQYRQ